MNRPACVAAPIRVPPAAPARDLRQRERELELLLVDELAAAVADDTFRRIIAGIE